MARQILSGDPRLIGPLAGQGYGGALSPNFSDAMFSEADPAALQLNADPMRADYLGALRQALPQAAARYRVSQWQPGVPQPGLIHDVGYGYGGPVGGAVADVLQAPKTGQEAAMMFGMPGVGMISTPRLYHGSPELALTELRASTRGPLGPGVYTSPAEQIAKSYAGVEGKVYRLPEKPRDLFTGAGHHTDEEWFGYKDDMNRLIAAAEPEKRAAIEEIAKKMWSGDGYPFYARLSQLYGGHEGAQALFKRAGFEGIQAHVDGPETLLFDKQALSNSLKPVQGVPVPGVRGRFGGTKPGDKGVFVNGKLYTHDSEHVSALEQAALDQGFASLDDAAAKQPEVWDVLDENNFGEIDKHGHFVPDAVSKISHAPGTGSVTYEDWQASR